MTVKSIHDLAALPTPLPSLSVTLPYAHYVLAKWNVGLLKYWYFFSCSIHYFCHCLQCLLSLYTGNSFSFFQMQPSVPTGFIYAFN